MKKIKKLAGMLLGLVTLVGAGAAAIACGGDEQPAGPSTPERVEGPEVGLYYYDANGSEYLLSLHDYDQATLIMGSTVAYGTYEKSGSDLTFKYSLEGMETMTATVNADSSAVTLTYNNVPMQFLRRVMYTVTFDSKSGSSVAATEVLNGKTLSKPSDPTRSGYTFLGWYSDANYTKPFVFGSDVIKANTTLYAQWGSSVFGENKYTVKFDLGYEGAVNPQPKQTVGGKLYNLETPTRSGYTFKGWWYSVNGRADQLTYKVDNDTMFTESTTLFAVWEGAREGDKLQSPVVSVKGNTISWESVANAASYHVHVEGPTGFTTVDRDVTGALSVDIPMEKVGSYTIAVTANSASNEANNSDPTYRTHKYNALSRVSLFSVLDANTLLWNAVENAEKYLVEIDCGNEDHNHNPFDNGLSTYFNFTNCEMQEDGILFTVTAVADGYTSSVSETYVYNRELAAISELRYDEATQTVMWEAVPNATGYSITIECGTAGHSHTNLDIGNKTSYCIKECAVPDGGIVVSVTPHTKGYNSPDPAEITVTAAQKSAPAAPGSLRIAETTLRWNAVAGVDKYVVKIGDKEVESTTNSLNLTTTDVNWARGTDYNISVKAVKGDVSSAWSDALDARYFALYSTLSYNKNTVSWRPVIGATAYEVRVNDESSSIVRVTDGATSARVKLTRAGDNKVEVRYYTGDTASEWVALTVKAYTLTLDTRGGTATQGASTTQYYAVGDVMTLPTAANITREGYDLKDWYNTPNGAEGNGLRVTDMTYDLPGDMILYANWVPKTYTVTLNYNGGGTGSVTKFQVTYGKPFKLPVPERVLDAMTAFGGWCANRSGTAMLYTDELGNSLANWSIASDMEIYARWLTVFQYQKNAGGSAGFYYTLLPGEIKRDLSTATIPATYQSADDDRPYPVTQIGTNAFSSCNGITEINLPNSIESIAPQAFNNYTTLRAINVYLAEGVGTNVYWSDDGVLYFNNSTASTVELWAMPRAKTGTYTLSSRVTTLPTRAFYYSGLDEVNIPASVTYVAKEAFYWAKIPVVNFLSATSGTTATTLRFEVGAFNSATTMTDITLPAHNFVVWDSDKNEAYEGIDFNLDLFYGCSALANVHVNPDNTNYQSVGGVLCTKGTDATIIYCPKTRSGSFTVPAGIYKIGSHAFSNCRNITEIVIPMWVKEIEAGAFTGYAKKMPGATSETNIWGCTALKTVVFEGGDGVAAGLKISARAFGTEAGSTSFVCNSLDTVTIKDGSKITSIGEYAFSRCPITSIVLPATLTELKEGAFYSCTQLATVEYAENGVDISIGNMAFGNCTGLTTIKLPKNITKFEDGVFAGCDNLAIIEVDPENPELSSLDGVLFNKNQTEIIFYPVGQSGNYTIPSTVERISSGAFAGKANITDVTISKNVTYIGAGAFRNCAHLTTVTFAEGGTEELVIGTSAFNSCTNLTTFKLPNRVKAIPDRMLLRALKLGEVYIPDGVETIGDYAFYMTGYNAAAHIKKITVPNTVYKIGLAAFASCSAEAIEFNDKDFSQNDDEGNPLPAAIKLEIVAAESAFASKSGGGLYADDYLPLSFAVGDSKLFFLCPYLASIKLPYGLEEMPAGMFQSCNKLTTVNVPGTVTKLGMSVFANCTSIETITFDERGTLQDDPTKKLALELENGTRYSGEDTRGEWVYTGVFSGCTKLVSISLPEGVTRIPNCAFAGCTSLASITIPASVQNGEYKAGESQPTAIGDFAFVNCTKLSTVTFTAGGTGDFSLGSCSFENCTSLQTITLPARLADSWINYPANLSYASNDVKVGPVRTGNIKYTNSTSYENANPTFKNCSSLTEINVATGGANYASDDGILYSADMTELVYVPNARSKDVTVPYTVTLVKNFAFFNNTKVKKVTFEEIPDDSAAEANGVAALDDDSEVGGLNIGEEYVLDSTGGAFKSTKIEEIYFPKHLASINDYAFYGCTALTKISFAEGTDKFKTIGKHVFNGCAALPSITLPDSLESIGENAFWKNTKLATLNINETSKLNQIGTNAFAYTGLTSVYLPPAQSFDLGAGVFSYCTNLKTVRLPNTLSSFDGLFSNSFAITSMTIYAVEGVQGSLESKDGVVFVDGGKTLSYYPVGKTDAEYSIPVGVTKISANAFANNRYITKVTIPNTVEVIGDKAFFGCGALQTVEFEKDDVLHCVLMTEEEKAAYGSLSQSDKYQRYSYDEETQGYVIDSNGDYRAINAKTLDVGVDTRSTSVGTAPSVFAHCIELVTVNFPERLQRLAAYSFYYCKKLTTVTFDSGCQLGGIEVGTFAETSLLYGGTREQIKANAQNPFTFPNSISSIAGASGLSNTYGKLTKLTIPAGVTNIGQYAFQNSTSLNEVEFLGNSDVSFYVGTSTSSVGYTFDGCTNLQTVRLPSGLTTMPKYMFRNCTSLTNINIPSGVKILGTSTTGEVFSGCTELTEIVLPSGLTNIEGSTFSGCTKLAKITYDKSNTDYDLYLPDKVTKIGASAFAGTAITTAYIPGSVTSLAACFGTNQTSKKETDAADTDVVICKNLKKVVFGTTTNNSYPTSIPSCMFARLPALEEVELSTNSRLIKIDTGAFCESGIKRIIIPTNITTISQGAFARCARLESVTFAENTTALTLTAATQNNLDTIWSGSNYKYFGVFAFSGTNNGRAAAKAAAEKSTDQAVKDAYAANFKIDMSKRKITTVGKWAFSGLSSLDVILSDETTSIATVAFQDAGISEITIPAKVTSIAIGAFANSGVSKVTFAPSATALTLTAGTAGTGTTDTDKAKFGVFGNCTSLTEVDMSKRKITSIPNYTFYNCESLSTVLWSEESAATEDAPATSYTTTIGSYAFQNAFNGDLVLPRGVTTVSPNAFRGSLVKSAVLPNTLTSLGNSAFYESKSLTRVEFEEDSVITAFVLSNGNSWTFGHCTSLQSIVLPASLTSIGNYEYYNTALTSVSIPKGVASIGSYAFSWCSKLASVTFEKDDEGECALGYIGAGAFEKAIITSFVIPKSVTSIGANPFRYCSKLTSLTVEDGNADFVAENNVVYNSDKSILFAYAAGATGAFTLPDTVVEIGDYAFAGSKFAGSITFAGEGFTVGSYAFAGSGITALTLGNNAIIGSWAFEDCTALTSVAWGTGATVDVSAFVGSGVTLKEEMLKPDTSLEYEGLKALVDGTIIFDFDISNELCKNNTDLEYAIIAEGVTTIGNYAFDGCVNLKRIVIPSTVTSIGNYAFRNCTSLTEIVFSKNGEGATELTTIGQYAFQNTGLTEIVIPKNVTYIRSYAFYQNAKLTSVVFEKGSNVAAFYTTTNSVPSASTDTYTFAECPKLASIVLPDNMQTITCRAFLNSGLKSIAFPATLVNIYNYAFQGCTQLETVTFEKDENGACAMNVIQTYAFSNSGVKNVTLPASLTTLGAYAFSGTKLTSINIPVKLASIGTNAFQNCESLAAVTFDRNEEGNSAVTSIGKESFKNTALTSISIPASVRTLGTNAFQDTLSLTSVVFEKDENGDCALTALGNFDFANTGLTTISIPKTVTTTGTNTFQDCTSLTEVIFEKDAEGNCALTTVDNYAFSNTKLTSISIPAKVTKIGTNAFQGCTGFNSVTFAKNAEENYALKTIDKYAFAGTAVTSVAIPYTVTAINANAFENCKSLTSVTWDKNADGNAATVTINENAFFGCTSIKHMIIPALATLYTTALNGFGEDCYIYFDGLPGPSAANWTTGSRKWLDGCKAKLVWGWSDDMGFIGPDGKFANGETWWMWGK